MLDIDALAEYLEQKIWSSSTRKWHAELYSVHAEQNAIIHGTFSDMRGATLYLSGFDSDSGTLIEAKPCPICSRMIRNAGITRVLTSQKTV